MKNDDATLSQVHVVFVIVIVATIIIVVVIVGVVVIINITIIMNDHKNNNENALLLTCTLFVPSVHTRTYGEHAFSCSLPTLWNNVSKDIRNSESVYAFKSALTALTCFGCDQLVWVFVCVCVCVAVCACLYT